MAARVSRGAAWLAAVLGTVGAQNDHDPQNYVYQRNSFSHPYTENGWDIPHWTYHGDTALTDQYIRLTPDHQSKKGGLWNTVPYEPQREGQPPEDSGFEVHLEFHVNGQGTSLYGDGFALWYTSGIQGIGPVFGSADKWIGMGVFFDTYSNYQQGHSQYISVMIGDGKQAYDHDKDGGDGKIAGCGVDFRGEKMDARIVYEPEKDGLLRMYTARKDEAWEECFIVRKVRLPRRYHFGLSAATGDLADNHDIISFKVSDPQEMSTDEALELVERIKMDHEKGYDTMEHHDPQYEDSTRSTQGGTEIPMEYSLLMILVVALVIAVVVYFTRSSQQHARTHFDN